MALPDWLPPGEPMTDAQFREWLERKKRAVYVTDTPKEAAPVTISPIEMPEEWSFSYRGKRMTPEEVLAVLDEEQKWLHGEVPTPEPEVKDIPVQKDGE